MFDLNKKEKPFTSFSGFGGGGLGLSGGVTKQLTYVDDLFSTALYRGNASSNTVPSGLDFTEGSWLSWIKQRDGNDSHYLSDSTQKTGVCFDSFASDRTYGKQTGETTGINAVGTSSYSIQGGNAQVNGNTKDYTSWNFKAAPGFMDIITWTGTDGSVERVLNHSLGSVPGMVFCKSTSNSGTHWYIYHKELGLNKYFNFNDSEASSSTGVWNSVTSTTFGLGTAANLNAAGREHVAYLFAHDDAQFGTGGNESIIKCGSYTGTGSTQTIDFGFEPQWVMIKMESRANTGQSGGANGNWIIFDNLRDVAEKSLYANTAAAEANYSGENYFTSNGITFTNNNDDFNDNYRTPVKYVYMAIRRPHKPPELATEVFNVIASDSPRTAVQRPEKVDMYWFTKTGGFSENLQIADRVRGFETTPTNSDNAYTTPTIFTNSVNQERESGNAIVQQDWSGGPFVTGVSSGNGFLNYMFKRAPGFFDIVAYTGNLTARTINHNLSAVPELLIVKNRTDSGGAAWAVWSSYMQERYRMALNDTHQELNGGTSYWNANSTFTTTTFGLGDSAPTNQNNHKFVGYLFASLAGISKIGTYSGNTGNAVNVPCGFAAGARFVLIKRTDAEVTGTNSSGWYIWDTARGIVSGNDPYLLMNKTDSQVTNTDYIDPLSTGFTVTASAPAALNASGGTYLFLAIA